MCSGPGYLSGFRRRSSSKTGGALCIATTRNASRSCSTSEPNFASQRRTAFSSIALNTGSSSPGEVLMTCRTSDVAVCCCSDSRSSLSRRVFSMAKTPCRAKLVTRPNCLVGYGPPHLLAVDADRAEQSAFLEHRHAEHCSSAGEIGESNHPRIAFEIWRHRSDVVDLHDFLGPANLGMTAFGMNAECHVLGRGEGGRCVVDCGNT